MNPPNNPQQQYWYKPIEERKPPLEPLTMLPLFETDERGLSVDVLVYGYFVDGNDLDAVQECYGIGYVDRSGKWYVSTTSGDFQGAEPNAANDTFTLLMWRYLDDPPCDLPSVNRSRENEYLLTHQKAAKPPHLRTSPYTPRPLGGLED